MNKEPIVDFIMCFYIHFFFNLNYFISTPFWNYPGNMSQYSHNHALHITKFYWQTTIGMYKPVCSLCWHQAWLSMFKCSGREKTKSRADIVHYLDLFVTYILKKMYVASLINYEVITTLWANHCFSLLFSY